MDGIMSEGGPLICIEQALAASWGGVDQLTVADRSAKSDYERACRSTADYLLTVPLARSSALALGLGPMNTFVWTSPSRVLFIMQLICAEANVDAQEKLSRHLCGSTFDEPIQVSKWIIASSPILLFDSAMPGSDPDKESLVSTSGSGAMKSEPNFSNPTLVYPLYCIASISSAKDLDK